MSGAPAKTLATAPRVRTGLDRVAAGEWSGLQERAVSLLCHPASVDRELVHARTVLTRAGARIVSLLGPEHGIDAAAQDMVEVGHGAGPAVDREVPIYSLYGDTFESLVPDPAVFHGAELLVCDLQDVGSRYYTYVWTMLLAAEVALGAGMEVLILDRPNPLGGLADQVEGGAVDPGFESFVGLHDVATRHGMTVGELVHMALLERGRVSADEVERRFRVLDCVGWRRHMLFSETGLPWVLPSPNMPTFETAVVYPGQCLLEGTNLSEGRGTTRPFELFGAPFLEGGRVASRVDASDLPGLTLRSCRFEPTFHKHARLACGGLQLHVLDPVAVRSLRTSWALLSAMWRESGGAMAWRTERYEFVEHLPAIDLLAGGAWLRAAVEAGEPTRALLAHCEPARQAFLRRRERFLRHD